MNKNELTETIAKRLQITKASSETFVNTFLDVLLEALKHEGKVSITDFGTFSVGKRKGRQVRDIITGNMIDIPESNELKLKPSIKVKKFLNE